MKNTEIIKYVTIGLLILISFSFIGCENNPTEVADYNPQPVLTAFIYCGQPVGNIKLIRVQSLYSYYDSANIGISGAEIILFPVNPPGSAGDTVHFQYQSPDGIYSPLTTPIIQGKIRYRIEATTPEGEFLWAETTVPDTFTLQIGHPSLIQPLVITPNTTSIDTLGTFNRVMPTLLFQWTMPDSCGGYIGNNICLTPIDSLVALDPAWEPEDTVDMDEPGRVNVDFYLRLQEWQEYPWISFEWEGWHRYEFMAVDKQYFDYVFSFFRTEQGVMTEPVYNVFGDGLGVFAGCCKNEFMLYMERVQ